MITEQKLKDILLAPPHKVKSINFQVRRFYTDVNGTIIAKAAAPAALQVNYPVYLFGNYDRKGAYFMAQRNLPALPGAFFLHSFTYGLGMPFFFGFNALSTIQRELKPGDIVNVYTDNLLAPSFFVYIVVSCDVKSAASLVENTSISPLQIKEVFYYSDNVDQWEEPIQRLLLDPVSDFQANYVEPFIYRAPETVQNGFVKLVWSITINHYRGLNTYLQYATDSMNLVFKLNVNKNELIK